MLNKITAKWEPLGQIPKVYADRTFKMRSMQAEAYAALADKRHVIINAPTASGKTLAICWILAKRLIESPQRKAIIAVPQTIIASGFRGYFNLSFTGEGDEKIDSLSPARWSPAHYLCCDTKESNISQLLSFLSREGNKSDFNDRVIICSHASLIDAFQQRPDLFKCADICIDEAHHVKYTVLDDEEEAEFDEDHTAIEFCNRMGELVSHSLKSADVSLILSTATLFRGDRLEIVPREKMSEFERFHYPMDAYLRDCHWLESFSYDFAMYEDRWGERMAEIFKESIGRTIVYLPSVGSKYYSYGSKEKDLKQVYRAIAGGKPKVKEEKSGLTLIKRGDKWVKVVNLVDDTPALREKRKELIIAAHDGDGSDIDIVVALNMFREGANWKWADREIIIGSKGSLTDMNQILGRLFRDAKDKKHVHAIQLLPFSFDQLNKDKFRDHLNEYSKTIFATMLFEDAIAPVDLQLPVRRDARTGRSVAVDHLRDQVGDENTIFQIWEEIRDEAIRAHDNKVVDFGKNDAASRKAFADIASEVLTEHGVTEFHPEIAEAIRRRWIREAIKKVGGVDLSGVDFDVVQINPLQHFLTYSSAMCGLDTFGKFRAAFERYGWSEDYNLEVCHPEIAAEWHKTKNGRLRARDFVPTSNVKVWWKGKCGHEWKTSISHRARRGQGCGLCYGNKGDFVPYREAARAARSLKIRTPREYFRRYKEKLGLPASPQVIYAEDWVSWPFFLRDDNETLESAFPDIAKQWHPTKNGLLLPSAVRPKSGKKVFWLGPCGHEWESAISHRANGDGCPFCARVRLYAPLSYEEAKIAVQSAEIRSKEKFLARYREIRGMPSQPNRSYKSDWVSWASFLGKEEKSLSSEHPELAEQWHSTKNGALSPSDVAPYSRKRVFWLGLCGHEWEARIADRSSGNGCPRCSGRRGRLDFFEARIIAKTLAIKSLAEYRTKAVAKTLPDGMPADPHYAYSSHPHWRGIKDFLGTEKPKPLCADNPKWEEFVKQNI